MDESDKMGDATGLRRRDRILAEYRHAVGEDTPRTVLASLNPRANRGGRNKSDNQSVPVVTPSYMDRAGRGRQTSKLLCDMVAAKGGSVSESNMPLGAYAKEPTINLSSVSSEQSVADAATPELARPARPLRRLVGKENMRKTSSGSLLTFETSKRRQNKVGTSERASADASLQSMDSPAISKALRAINKGKRAKREAAAVSVPKRRNETESTDSRSLVSVADEDRPVAPPARQGRRGAMFKARTARAYQTEVVEDQEEEEQGSNNSVSVQSVASMDQQHMAARMARHRRRRTSTAGAAFADIQRGEEEEVNGHESRHNSYSIVFRPDVESTRVRLEDVSPSLAGASSLHLAAKTPTIAMTRVPESQQEGSFLANNVMRKKLTSDVLAEPIARGRQALDQVDQSLAAPSPRRPTPAVGFQRAFEELLSGQGEGDNIDSLVQRLISPSQKCASKAEGADAFKKPNVPVKCGWPRGKGKGPRPTVTQKEVRLDFERFLTTEAKLTGSAMPALMEISERLAQKTVKHLNKHLKEQNRSKACPADFRELMNNFGLVEDRGSLAKFYMDIMEVLPEYEDRKKLIPESLWNGREGATTLARDMWTSIGSERKRRRKD